MAKTSEELESTLTQLKTQYSPVYTVEVPVQDSDEFRTIFLKKYDRQLLAATQKMVSSGSDTLKAIEIFVQNTYVGGDDLKEIFSNLDMLRSLESVVVEMMTVKSATIKKN